jgi:hypothetical protein
MPKGLQPPGGKGRLTSGAEAGDPAERSSSGSGGVVLVPKAAMPSTHGCTAPYCCNCYFVCQEGTTASPLLDNFVLTSKLLISSGNVLSYHRKTIKAGVMELAVFVCHI